MALERLRAVAEKKLAKLGIKLDYTLHLNWKEETGTDTPRHAIYINPDDTRCKTLAMQNMQHLLLHEIGHVFLHTYVTNKIRKNPEFKALFGDTIKGYRRKRGRMKTSPDFISNYAQVQSRDDFCETFAVYVAFEGNMRKIKAFLRQRKKGPKVLKKVIWIRRFVKII